MALETESLEMLQKLLEMDDKTLEEGYDKIIQIFESNGSFDQAIIEKISYCRANNLTIDDLIEENRMVENDLPEDLLDLSPIKQKLMSYILTSAARINQKIIEKGLHSIVKVRVERLPNNNKLPAYAHELGDSGLDVFLVDDITIIGGTAIVAKTGIKVAIPVGYELQVRPRSGISLQTAYQNLIVGNSPGTIDANYRDEVGIILKNLGQTPIALTKGMRVAQLVLAPVIKLEWVEIPDINVFPTDRNGGWGSSGV